MCIPQKLMKQGVKILKRSIMQFYSLNQQSPKVSFKEAVIRGIAPDKGLYFPSAISPINKEVFEHIDSYTKPGHRF